VKLVVPYIEALATADARLIRLAEFLGIECETLALERAAGGQIERLVQATGTSNCLAVNPSVVEQYLGAIGLTNEWANALVERVPFVLVHAARPEPFHSKVVHALTGGAVTTVRQAENAGAPYSIASDARDIAEAFAGMSFGPSNPQNDRVFAVIAGVAVRNLISIGGEPLFATLHNKQAQIFLVASEGVADLDAEAVDTPIANYFSQLMPHVMALRAIFGEQCWRPAGRFASVVVDDPLLKPSYGFLNFAHLLELTEKHNFQTTIAFIPHNFRRNSARTVRMFQENPQRLALCFHGNDHTGAEFASTEAARINTMLKTAEERMDEHRRRTGLNSDRVMVFPQGRFSVEAMAVLKARNFECAVNTVPRPMGSTTNLTLRELAQPAVTRYAGFPLFLRKNSLRTESADIAFNLFFGRPALIVEHHDIFKNPQRLLDAVSRINAAAPDIRWSNLGAMARGSYLRRARANGPVEIRAYARTVAIENPTHDAQRFEIEWNQSEESAPVEEAQRNAERLDCVEAGQAGARLRVEIEPGRIETLSLVHRNSFPVLERGGVRQAARAIVRRRLSEVRDNYLSKNQPLLAAATTLKKRLQH